MISAYARSGRLLLRTGSQEHELDEAGATRLSAELRRAIDERLAQANHVMVLPEAQGIVCRYCQTSTSDARRAVASWRSEGAMPLRVYERALGTFTSQHAACEPDRATPVPGERGAA